MHVCQLQAIKSSSTYAARYCLKPAMQLYLCAAQADPKWSGFALLRQRNRQPVMRLLFICFATQCCQVCANIAMCQNMLNI